MTNAVIELENVWKLFGSRASEAMQAIQAQGLGKAEVLEQFDAVVGVKDASISNACSPASGCEIKSSSVFTPNFFA